MIEEFYEDFLPFLGSGRRSMRARETGLGFTFMKKCLK